jgi:hypothetical protein
MIEQATSIYRHARPSPARDWFITPETLAGCGSQSQQSQPLAQPGERLVKSQTETRHNLDVVEAYAYV